MQPIETPADYHQHVEQIRQLKNRLLHAANCYGNLAPEVIRLSQEVDQHIVAIQRYWDRLQSTDQWFISR